MKNISQCMRYNNTSQKTGQIPELKNQSAITILQKKSINRLKEHWNSHVNTLTQSETD